MAALVIATMLIALGGASIALRKFRSLDEDTLVARIDNCLPQTQCAQCGYPGCGPYAEAVAGGTAATNLCAPGGTEVMERLNDLVGSESATPLAMAPALSHLERAQINEADCIGCTLCLPPCPVDAIVGASGYMHTVITEQCTGCELCVDACPVDCIEMIAHTPASSPAQQPPRTATQVACIRCGACSEVCPVSLPAQSLLELVDLQRWSAVDELELGRCIECGLCDEACPSLIPLEQQFAYGKAVLAELSSEALNRQTLKDRHNVHQQRLQDAQTKQHEKRQARLEGSREWSA